jgi:methionyl-tRNA formyltransferase
MAESEELDVVLAVTQAPKTPSPVELVAGELNIPIYKPATLRDADSRQPLIDAEPDLFVVAAFGLIFRPRTLAIPKAGSLNVHPSLLPRFRGANPIAMAIHQGDAVTGVSIMEMDAGIDTGAVVSVEEFVADDNMTTESLTESLGQLGAEMIVRDAPRWVRGELQATPQVPTEASLTRTMTKADGEIDWWQSAPEIERHVRAMWPWPRAWTTVDGTLLQVHESRVVEQDAAQAAPGSTLPEKRRLIVQCGSSALELLTVEPAGKRAMSAAAYLNGRRTAIVRLGAHDGPINRPPLFWPV